MQVQIVTDSTADIDRDTADSLRISVVPIYVRWESEVFRDGIDLTPTEFYTRLVQDSSHPATTQPSPEDFVKVYQASADSAGIVSIHISSKISGTFNSARIAADQAATDATPVEVIDSGLNSAGLGLVVLAAAESAAGGATFDEVVAEARRAAEETRMIGLFDTMKYLARSGRISPARGLAGRVLGVKPILTFRDGAIVRAGLARSRTAGMNRLLKSLEQMGDLSEIIVSHSTTQQELDDFVSRVNELYPQRVSHVFEMGAALGVHGGPGMIIVAGRCV